jgi:hypothetical protein
LLEIKLLQELVGTLSALITEHIEIPMPYKCSMSFQQVLLLSPTVGEEFLHLLLEGKNVSIIGEPLLLIPQKDHHFFEVFEVLTLLLFQTWINDIINCLHDFFAFLIVKTDCSNGSFLDIHW